MVVKSHGKMKKARHRMKSSHSKAITKYVREFKVGDRVVILPTPSSKIIDPEFRGDSGIVEKKVGRAYVVRVSRTGAEKLLSMKPEHLKKI